MPRLSLPTISPEVGDLLWLLLCAPSIVFEVLGALEAYNDLVSSAFKVGAFLISGVVTIAIGLQFLLSIYSYGVGRLVTKRPIGCYAKCMVDVLTLGAAVILGHFLQYNYSGLISLVGFTVDLHALSHLRRVASDINIWDMLFGVLMQALVYTTGENPSAYVTVLVVCGVIILYRFLSYKAPTTASDVGNDQLEKVLY